MREKRLLALRGTKKACGGVATPAGTKPFGKEWERVESKRKGRKGQKKNDEESSPEKVQNDRRSRTCSTWVLERTTGQDFRKRQKAIQGQRSDRSLGRGPGCPVFGRNGNEVRIKKIGGGGREGTPEVQLQKRGTEAR